MLETTGDILNVTNGIIGHQVNCQMVMGAGLAKQLRGKWPQVFSEYNALLKRIPLKKRLGKCQIVEIYPRRLYVANLFGQYNYIPRGVQHTDYTALAMALRHLNFWRNKVMGPEFPISLPHGLGCGLAGGSWHIVRGIIQDTIPNARIIKLSQMVTK